MSDMLDFATGAAEAEEFVKSEAEARKAARGGTNWFSLKEDRDMEALRFLIPHTKWTYTKQHDFIKPKAAPSDKPTDRDWPKTVGAICRYTPVGPNKRPAFDECYICDNMKDEKGRREVPTNKIWTLAAARLSLIGTDELAEQGRIHPTQVGQKVIIDEAELVDEMDPAGNTTGNKVWRKKIYIVNQSVRNFFSPLTTIAGLQGTITDRDYMIIRKGEKGGNKVDYETVDLGPFDVTVYKEGSDSETEVIRYDTADPRIAKLYDGHGIDVAAMLKMINRRVSKQYYDFYFDPRASVSWKDFYQDGDGDSSAASSAAPPPPPSAAQQAGHVASAEPTQGVPKERLEEMRAQVLGSASQAQTAAAPAVQAAPPPPV